MKKKFFLIMVAVMILLHANIASAASFNQDIRVLLSTDNYTSMDVTVSGDYYIQENPEFDLGVGDITLWIEGDRAVIRNANDFFSAPKITLVSTTSVADSYIGFYNAVNGYCTYLGQMEFSSKGEQIRAINTLPIEQYLYGVVPFEMSNRFPIEALKAQAVCARSYAASKCIENRDLTYDIVDTANHQVYYGYSSQYTRAISAVNQTEGMVIMSDGVVVQSFFTASNGGQTELTANVWSEALPYYIQQDDIFDLTNPDSPEQKSFIPKEFNSQTIDLMDPIVFSLLKTKVNERVGEDCVLVSTVDVTPKDPIYATPSRSFSRVEVVLMVADRNNKVGQVTINIAFEELIDTEETPGIFNKNSPYLRMRGAESGSMVDENMGEEIDGWYLTNRRYGHGIGLSQRGAQQRATSGQTFNNIINFYYSNISLIAFQSVKPERLPSSTVYQISMDGILDVESETEIQSFINRFSSDDRGISLVSFNGQLKTEGIVFTGDYLRTVNELDETFIDLPIIISGDVSGDGMITSRDIDLLQWHLLGTRPLRGAYLYAADVNRDGEVSNMDLLALIWHLNGKSLIS